jgi:hypothetical protein
MKCSRRHCSSSRPRCQNMLSMRIGTISARGEYSNLAGNISRFTARPLKGELLIRETGLQRRRAPASAGSHWAVGRSAGESGLMHGESVRICTQDLRISRSMAQTCQECTFQERRHKQSAMVKHLRRLCTAHCTTTFLLITLTVRNTWLSRPPMSPPYWAGQTREPD